MMPKQRRLAVNGVEIAAYEWGETREDLPDVLFAHAAGLHGRVWDAVIELLPDFHCWAVDLRGHGQSSGGSLPINWRDFGADMSSVGSALELQGAVGVGHSLGGHCSTLAAAVKPELFGALLLIDPVIFRREQYVGVNEGEHFTARRRREWESPDAMYERFKDRPPFSAWQPRALRDYVNYGLLPNPDGGGYVLACDPAFEGAVYNAATAANIYDEIAAIDVPVTVLRAAGGGDASAANFAASPTAPDLAAQFQHGTDVYLPEYSHFMPMEAPDVVAAWVRRVAVGRH